MGWIISNKEYETLRHDLSWSGGGDLHDHLEAALNRAVKVKVEDKFHSPFKWVPDWESEEEIEDARKQ